MTIYSPLMRVLCRKDYKTASILLNEVLKGTLSFRSEDVLNCLKCGCSEIEFLAVKILKRFPSKFKKEEIKKSLEMEEEEVNSFLRNRAVEFLFPVVGEKGGKIAKGIAVQLDSNRIISNNEKVVSVPFVEKGYLVFFDSKFDGNSFQVPFLVAVSLGNYPKGYLLTGAVDSNGEIYADKIEEKKKVAEESGRVLIYGGNVMSLIKIFKERKIDLPLLLSTVSDILSLYRLCRASNINVEMVQRLTSMAKEEFLFSLPQYISVEENWYDYVLSARKQFYKLKSMVENSIDRAVFHVALRMPSPLAVGIGASIGTGKIPLALYHFESGKYVKMIDLTEDSRKIKKRKSDRTTIVVSKDIRYENRESCVVGIQLASHRIEGKALDKLIETVKGNFFFIEHREYVGALPLDSNWTEVVAEINSAIADVHKEYSEIHIVMSVPVVVAFALGMALGHYWNINFYQFDKEREKYVNVLNLKEIPLV